MFKFTIQTGYRYEPYKFDVDSYKIRRNFLTINLTNKKMMCFNMNKLEWFGFEEEEK